MQITNDIITFDARDFEGLSPFARRALDQLRGADAYLGQFSNLLTQHVVAAKVSAAKPVLAEAAIDEIINGLAAADQAKRDEVAALIEQLRIALQ